MATLLTCYYKPKPGGFCKRLFRAVNALLTRGHEVHYLAVTRFPIDHPGCCFHRFPWPADKADGLFFWAVFHLLAPWMLTFIGIRHGVDRAFAFGSTYGLLLQPLRILKHLDLSLFLRADIITNHRLLQRPKWIIRLETLLERLALTRVRLYCVSQALLDAIQARHPNARPVSVGVLPNEIPASATTSRRPPPRTPLRLGMVGVLEPRKNQRLLLDCLATTRAMYGDLLVTLRFYGSGKDETPLRAMAERLGVSAQVEFMGWMPADRIWPELDLLLFPSLHEGAPNAVLEAIGNQVPVLASDIPEHRELLPHQNLLSAREPRAWVRVLHHIVQQPRETLDRLRTSQTESSLRLRFDWDQAFSTTVLNGDH